MTGDDLREFVSGRLFPHLAGFKQRASGPNTIAYKVGESPWPMICPSELTEMAHRARRQLS